MTTLAGAIVLTAALFMGIGCRGDKRDTVDPKPDVGLVSAADARPSAPASAAALDAAAAPVTDAGAPPAAGAGTGAKRQRRKSAAAPTAPGGGAISALKVEGNIPAPAINQALRAKAEDLRACHAQAAATQPDLRGQVHFKLTINDRGVVEIAEVMKSTLGGSDAEMCMVQASRRIKFPRVPGAGPSTVTFQMRF